jgi:hypothetical protein
MKPFRNQEKQFNSLQLAALGLNLSLSDIPWLGMGRRIHYLIFLICYFIVISA